MTSDVGLGFGWVHSLAWSLEERGKEIVLRTGDGRRLEIPRPTEMGRALAQGGWMIVRGDDFYAVMPGSEFEHYFEPEAPGSKRYRLRFVKYRNRGAIALQYERGLLARAVDAAGRVVLFERNADGRLASISVPDAHGRSIVFARYAYDDHGNLVAAADADGHVTAYAYDDEHRLTRLEYPSGLVYHYVYDRRDRCVETWGEYPGRTDPALAPDLPGVLRDGTRAKGIHHCRLEYSDDGSYTEVVDSVRIRRYFAGPNGVVAKSVNALGGVTTRQFDDRGRVTAQIDAAGGTWTYEYDDLDKIVRETDPEGHTVVVRRDSAGNELEVVDPAGGATTLGRDAHGEITTVRDAAGGFLELRLNAQGLVVEAIDTRGGRHLYEWDDHGNCVARTFPNGARFGFEYDWWGRLVREIDPAGGLTQHTYDNRGSLTSTTDPIGRTTSYAYDGMGQVVAETRPDGATTYRDYGGLHWLWRVRNPDGTELRAAHNREGWPEYFENERGERHEFRHNGEGLITWERNFHGQEYRFRYDLMGRVIGYEDALGRREMVRSPTGRLMREVAPDGSVREYAYNARGDLVRAMAGPDGLELIRDPMGRVLRETLHVEGETYAVDSHRTPAGDRTAYRTSLGLDMLIRRDPVGRVAELWNGGQRVLGITRSSLSQPVRRDFQDGGAVVDTYDITRRLRRREIVGPAESSVSAGEPAWVGGTPHGTEEHLYDYTPINEVQRVERSPGGAVEYEYDVRRRLTRVQRGPAVEQYAVDAVGNYAEAGPNAAPTTFGAGSQLLRRAQTDYRYDDRGQLVEKRRSGQLGDEVEVTRFRWNAWGLLDRVDLPDGRAVELRYDPFARRLGKRVLKDGKVVERHHYVWDQLAMVHDVDRDDAGNTSGVRSYLFEDNDDSVPLGQWDGTRWLHYVNDVNGTPDEIVDGSGRIVGRLDRETFGVARSAPGSTATTPFRFPGQIEDAETGLHYNRYRYYDPEIGRYISPDPIGLDGGWNLYAYGPNPVGWADPMGWVHVMTVAKSPPGFATWASENSHNHPGAPSTYRSGMQQTTNCPEDLNNRGNCHTEQKFAHDLIEYGRRSGPLSGEEYKLVGQLPPCPTCHHALMNAAGETGASISYAWEQPSGSWNAVTYNGSSAPCFEGDAASALGSAGYGQPRESSTTRWGYSGTGSAWSTYRSLRDQKLKM